MDTYRTFSTKLGYMLLDVRLGAVQNLMFGLSSRQAAQQAVAQLAGPSGDNSSAADHSLAEEVQDRLCRFAVGEAVDFDDITVGTVGLTEFQRRVIAACRAIPWGETRSYGQLAEAVGRPRAARAVGSVMSHNRVPLIVPCHRVLGASGRLGGYSAPDGLVMKRRLLQAEKRALCIAR